MLEDKRSFSNEEGWPMSDRTESLNLSFALLALCGIWREHRRTTRTSAWLVEAWQTVVMSMPYLLAAGQLTRLLLVELEFQEITEILFVFLSILNVCCKSASFTVQQSSMLKLLEMLAERRTLPRDPTEFAACRKYRRYIWYMTLSNVVLVEITALTFTIMPFFQSKANRSLPFKIWLPYDYSSDKLFWITYTTEAFFIIVCSLVSVSSNTLIFGFLIEACIQLELLMLRFGRLPQLVQEIENEKPEIVYKFERGLMNGNIRHHAFVFEFVEALKRTFFSAILGQFVVSSLVISMSIYQLSMNKSIDLLFLTNLLYLLCMLMEFFFYCWFGNMLTHKSEIFVRSVFKINWITLSSRSNKDILLVMLRSSRPIIISSGTLVVLSLEYFMKVIKLSYSAFSVLRSASDD